MIFKDLNEAYPKLVNLIVNDGMSTAPRNIETIEVENISITYQQPTYIFLNKARHLNPVFHLVELFYFMDGRNDNMLSRYISQMSDYVTPETRRFDGSYGPPIFECLPYVAHLLKEDRSSRRASFPILRMQHVSNPFRKDHPCNIILGFKIRDNKLNMNVVTRSQDLYRGFLYDTLEFQLLQALMARLLQCNIGIYHHDLFSLHLYANDLEKAQRSARSMPSAINGRLPEFPEFKDFQDLWEYTHVRCTLADNIGLKEVQHNEMFATQLGLQNDEIARALLSYMAREPSKNPVHGTYPFWVNGWLD